jgi:predicted nucleic acid-binding protein
VLHAEWQNEGDLLNYDGADTNVYINTIDNGAGTIAFAATRLDVATGVTTPGTLAVVKFTAIRKGECSDLTLTEVVVADKDEETVCEAYCWEGNELADRADLNDDYNVNILDAVIIGTCWGDVAY